MPGITKKKEGMRKNSPSFPSLIRLIKKATNVVRSKVQRPQTSALSSRLTQADREKISSGPKSEEGCKRLMQAPSFICIKRDDLSSPYKYEPSSKKRGVKNRTTEKKEEPRCSHMCLKKSKGRSPGRRLGNVAFYSLAEPQATQQ